MTTIDFLLAFVRENKLPSKYILCMNISKSYATGQCIILNLLIKHDEAYYLSLSVYCMLTIAKFSLREQKY